MSANNRAHQEAPGAKEVPLDELLEEWLRTKKISVDEYTMGRALLRTSAAEELSQAGDDTACLQRLKSLLGESDLARNEACWPDGVYQHRVVADDVSQLNPTNVTGIFQVRTIEDIQQIIRHAQGRTVTARGAKHSMGGQSISHNGLLIDMSYVKHMEYHPKENTVTVGCGALWSDLIKYLNPYGKSPRTLQSYCSFSVGGTLSVNGHGITTDYTVSESVTQFRLVQATGKVIECSRDAESEEARELFKLCLGGYGLFGVIYDVTLKVSDNTMLAMDNTTVLVSEFPAIYDAVLLQDDVEMKLARIDTTTFETIDLFVFTRDCDTPTVSGLPVKPKEMSTFSAFIYKWMAAPLREVRFAMERSLGMALDWSGVSNRNEMLYESAAPLARLYSPLVLVDDTFVLQEYFIPKAHFLRFMREAKCIVVDKLNHETLLTLLNITIRFVHHDTDTALPYASSPDGMFAFVLYYRLRRTDAADRKLAEYHDLLATAALRMHGTFYLPYRHHFSNEQLAQAYPTFHHFQQRKAHYDPDSTFGNLWWDRYGHKEPRDLSVTLEPYQFPNVEESTKDVPEVSTHRTDSFVRLMKDPDLRKAFRESFLVEIFTLAPPQQVWKLLTAAVWQETSKQDNDIYTALQERYLQWNTGLTKATGLWSQVKQISAQKRELVREIISVLARMGQLGRIHTYCSIGDHGKLILPLRAQLQMTGPAYIVHDVNASETDIPGVLERGEIHQADVGTFVYLGYNQINEHALDLIPAGSCDLVTMNQGLHHLPPDKIPCFLALVHRILAPGGIFITREHDLDPDKKLLPMLDCAHMVFNALTGVPSKEERKEIRGFRSVLEWRQIIESAGFVDSMVYEMQPDDPTVDIMMCFYKDQRQPPWTPAQMLAPPAPQAGASRRRAKFGEEIAKKNPGLMKIADHAPQFVLNVGIQLVNTLIEQIPAFRDWLQTTLLALMPDTMKGLQNYIKITLDSAFDFVLLLLNRFPPLTTTAVSTSPSQSPEFIPNELFLLWKALRVRAEKGELLESILMGYADKLKEHLLQIVSGSGGDEGIKASALSPPGDHGRGPTAEEVDAVFDDLLVAIPQMAHLSDVIGGMGLPPRLTAMIMPYCTEIDVLKAWIVSSVDGRAWIECQASLRAIQEERSLPHVDRILQPYTCWNRLARALLGLPSVKIGRARQYLMRSAFGLGDLVDLWKQAQRERLATATRRQSSIHLPEACRSTLDLICPMKTYEGPLNDTVLEDVLVIEHATFVIRGIVLSGKSHDVTEIAEKCFDAQRGCLDLSELVTDLPGSLLQGSRTIKVEYRARPSGGDLTGVISSLSQKLAEAGIIDGTWRKANGPFTWYKLPEWLQVEIVQMFGDSMSHTPWYRFPFWDVLKTYWDVLCQEFLVVSELHGKSQALLSSAFITDTVPMAVMAVLFAQLSALAYPLRLFAGSEYNEDTLVEQVLIAAPRVEWAHYKDYLAGSVQEITPGIFVVPVKTFQPLTHFLVKLAKNAPTAVVLEISNQSQVQVKVILREAAQLALFNNMVGCDVKFHFQMPQVGHQTNPMQVALGVSVSRLLAVIQFCEEKHITIAQIYDFFG